MDKFNTQTITARDLAYQSYSDYATYVNMHRAIPNIADGLIPVHRRILLAADKYKGLTLSNSIVSDTTRDYHGHGSASVEPVLSTLVRRKLLEGKGNHGLSLMEYVKHAAPRYTKASRSEPVSNVLLRLKDYAPHNINDLGHDEPDFLITPVPLALVYGHFGIGIGCNSRTPAFTYQSLVEAHRHNDYKLLRAQYGYYLGSESELQDLWESGYGAVEYKMSCNYEWSLDDECNVTVIEGRGDLFIPNLSELEEHLESGRVFIRDESTTHIRLVVGRSKGVRAITDEQITEICERASSMRQVYDLKVAAGKVVRRVSIKDWMDVCNSLYNDAHANWQKDKSAGILSKIKLSLMLPLVAPYIMENLTDEEILTELSNSRPISRDEPINKLKSQYSDHKIPEYAPESFELEDIKELMKLPIRRLRNTDNVEAVSKLKDELYEIMNYDSVKAIDEAAKVIKV